MMTTMYYFSGTGNSLAVAKGISRDIGECELVPLGSAAAAPGVIVPAADRVGIVSPVYFAGLPSIVADFSGRLDLSGVRYAFGVMTMGGSGGSSALRQLDAILKGGPGTRGLDSGFSVRMPGNYLLLYNSPGGKKCEAMLLDADRSMHEIAGAVRKEAKMTIPWSPLQSIIHRMMYPRFVAGVHEADRSFSVDDRCTSCGTCAEVCPVGNIRMEGGHPTWLHHCEQCLACIHLCPTEAIQAGKKTEGRTRYHHPGIGIEDLKGQSGKPPSK